MLKKQERYLRTFENCDLFVDLGIHIAYFRKKAGYTQQKFADILGIERTYLSCLESPNQNTHPSFELFFTMSRVLNVPPHCFFEPLPDSE